MSGAGRSARVLLLALVSGPLGCGDTTTTLIRRPTPEAGGCEADADCAASAPRCAVDAGRCVECVDSVDCTASNAPVCDVRAARCVACVSDGHCADPETRCSPTSGLCAVPCAGQDDCEDSDQPLCDVTLGFCVGCVTDLDCGEEGFCRASRCYEPDEEEGEESESKSESER